MGSAWNNATEHYSTNPPLDSVELGASLFGRQGYPYPVYRDVTLGRDSSRRVFVSPHLDSIRYDDLWNLDLRVRS